jgi:micrococcal nuclease
MICDNYTRAATVRKVIDGDTIEVMIDDGRRQYSVERVRLLRINTPEIKGEEMEAGLASKSYVESVLPAGSNVVIQTHKSDSFDRWLAELWYINNEGVQINLNDELLNKGLAEPYNR